MMAVLLSSVTAQAQAVAVAPDTSVATVVVEEAATTDAPLAQGEATIDGTTEETAEETSAPEDNANADQVDAAPKAAALLECGGAPTVWIGESQAQSDLISRDQAWQAPLSAAQSQGRAFHLSAPAAVRLEAIANNEGDPALQLLDAAGETIAENDDANDSYNPQIITQLPAGDYCVFAEDLRRSMDLTLLVGLESHETLLASNELVCGPQTEALNLSQGDLTTSLAAGPLTQSFDGRKPGYARFTLSAPLAVSLRASTAGEADPLLALFDAAGNEIARNDDADGKNARLDFMPSLAAGSYCIGLRSATPSAGQITFSAQQIDPQEYKQRAYDRGEMVPLEDNYPLRDVTFNQSHGEVILQGPTVTWLHFDLDERSIVVVRTLGTPTGADTMLSLFDGSGEQLVQVDDTDSSRNAMIAPMILQPGRYFLALSDRASSNQRGAPLRPVVLMAERYIRASAD